MILLVFTVSSIRAAVSYGQLKGYISDVESERYLKYYEINSFPKPMEKKSYYKLIFKQNLADEFRHQYKLQFGYSGSEQVYNQLNHFSEVEYLPGVRVSIEEDSRRQKAYGEYMVKRLAEYHVDEYTKNKPELKTIYEVKERLSHANVKVQSGYEVKVHYSLSGNYINFDFINPYEVSTVYSLIMSTDQFGPSNITERALYMGYNLTKTIHLSSEYKEVDGVFKVVGTKHLKKDMSTSLTGVTNTHNHGTSQREDLVLLGFSWAH